MFQKMTAESPEKLVAESMRHPEGLWTAVTIRPRTVVYNKSKFAEGVVLNYSDLTSSEFENKLCLRTSQSSYNVALVSSFIQNMGYENTKVMLSGWLENLATEIPSKNDRGVLDSIAEGTCDVGVVNSYYLAQKLIADPGYPVGILFADQGSTGVHVNGTGVGISVHSKKVVEASAFIDLMLSDSSQLHFSSKQSDYPAKIDLLPNTLVKDWGLFKADPVNWSVLGLQHEKAQKLFEEINYL